MANQRVTDLDPIVTLPDSGIIHVVDTTNNTQNAAGSSFKITKANLLKENTAAILLNTAKVGISTAQATAITNNTNKVGYTDVLVAAAPTVVANTVKVGITPTQATAITTNSSKVGYTDALVAAAPTVVANTAKVGISSTQATAITNNTAKVGYTEALVNANASVVANSAKVGITPAQATAITTNSAKVGITTAQSDAILLNTANTSKVSINNDAASVANVRSLRYREETYSSNLDVVMQTNVGVYNWTTIFTSAFNIANAIMERFKTRVATDGGVFEAQALTEAGLNTNTTLSTASFVMTANSSKLSKIYAAFPNLATSDFSFNRNSTAIRINSAGNREVVPINTPIINYPISGGAPELLLEPQRTNLLLNSAVLVTQSITTTAEAHALSFTGTGTVTLSGTFSGSLAGTGANNVVSLNFTPTSGTLTVTISGSCTLGQIEAGVNATANIPTLGAAVTRVSANNIILNGIDTKGFLTATQGTIFLKLGLVSNDAFSSILLNLSLNINTPFQDRVNISAINGFIRLQVAVNNVAAFNYIDNVVSASNSRVVVTYLNGTYKLFINGVLRFTSPQVTQIAYTSMQLTNQNSGGNIDASRAYKSLLLYNTALTDTQAINLI